MNLPRFLLAAASAFFVAAVLQANDPPLALLCGFILGGGWTLVVLDLF